MHVCVCACVCMFVCLFVCLSVCLLVILLVGLFGFLFVCCLFVCFLYVRLWLCVCTPVMRHLTVVGSRLCLLERLYSFAWCGCFLCRAWHGMSACYGKVEINKNRQQTAVHTSVHMIIHHHHHPRPSTLRSRQSGIVCCPCCTQSE